MIGIYFCTLSELRNQAGGWPNPTAGSGAVDRIFSDFICDTGPPGASGMTGAQGSTGPTGSQGQPGITVRGPAASETGWISLRDIMFDYDTADLRPSEMNKISEVAAYLKQNPSIRVGIDGNGSRPLALRR
jgi:outer membrane protein OmpA-like peptidoglycan-associated protein